MKNLKQKPEKLNLQSMNITEEQKKKLRQLFPEVFNENKIDWERLKATLGEELDKSPERYHISWPGKSDCFGIIQKPSLGALKPCKEESLDWDKTQNLFIEGDNLEVLKLLQHSYYGKVKMIYIDPPYNTGKDFIYPDKYSDNLETYLQYTEQKDAQGKKFSTNQETDGRFHSKWINMMYPRLFLARNLLKDDGVIFISIDDNEVTNLRKICDEIFGEENFCGNFIWEKKKKPSFLKKTLGSVTEFIICYAKNYEFVNAFISGSGTQNKKYPLNNAGNSFNRIIFPKGTVKFLCEDQIVKAQNMSAGNIKTILVEDVTIKYGTNQNNLVLDGEWRYSQDTINNFLSNGEQIVISKIPFRPNYINKENRNKKTVNFLSHRINKIPTNEDATKEIKNLFNFSVMDYPKPVGLLKFLASLLTKEHDIILDFFTGSGTTAHAVYEKNLEDGGNRKYICVQLPEPTSENTEAYKAGYKNIADIGKERIRRAVKKMKEENKQQDLLNEDKNDLDLGFKVFKLDKSNFKIWDERISKDKDSSEQIKMHLEELIDKKSTDEDLLYEILIKTGYPLTTKIKTLNREGKIIYSIENNALVICLEKQITKELIKELAKLKPARVVCLDIGFEGNDQLKTNAFETFKSHGVNDFKTV